MLTIRLSRIGKKKQPHYRIVLQESHRDPWSPAKEILGQYDPRAKKDGITFNEDRINYWLSVGVQPSTTVHNMLVNAGIIKAEKQSAITISKKRTKKIGDKKQAEESEKVAKAEAAKAKEDKEAQDAKEAEEAKKAEEAEAAKVEEVKVKEEKKEEAPIAETSVEEVKEETPAK